MDSSCIFESPYKISSQSEKKYYRNQILCLLNFSMSSAVTRVFFFKPIIGGERCLRGGVGRLAHGWPQSALPMPSLGGIAPRLPKVFRHRRRRLSGEFSGEVGRRCRECDDDVSALPRHRSARVGFCWLRWAKIFRRASPTGRSSVRCAAPLAFDAQPVSGVLGKAIRSRRQTGGVGSRHIELQPLVARSHTVRVAPRGETGQRRMR